ncbi:MAG TPA: NnrS family protein [Methyloprofundus sp.]|uniref:NnrS family protein n=1 Tax=Methyloprofundus sp. TaxID=2020875 RepID=UPI0017C56EA0|nr:NnrS family protein [Methyloprofundus sp.]HIG65839.1 NnrS family protein [Methyloprofundus sp.]HIL77432.1 NnrS family protein [Methylococcales bacterium]
MNHNKPFNIPFFALGFRTFFALSGLSALVLMLVWRALYDGSLVMDNYFVNNYWHAHEMLLGYTVAVIAGFLLTSVKNWTGQKTLTGMNLAGLALLWVYGRILPFYSGLLADEFIGLVDFMFLPVLAFSLLKPIMAAKYTRGYVFIALLLIMSFGNGLIHMEILGLSEQTAWTGFQIVIDLIIVMILVIAGRVFPFFTEKGLSGTWPIRNPLYDALSIGSAALVFGLMIMQVSGFVLALAASVAAVCNILRVNDWYVFKLWFVPLLWVLYIGYGWIIIGFILTALSAFEIILPTLALHAFTMGGIGVITLGMMARVSLGHTGRVLKASQAMAIAFALINIATLVRVFIPILLPAWYTDIIYVATLLWLAAFSLFAYVYAPILTTARADGKEG